MQRFSSDLQEAGVDLQVVLALLLLYLHSKRNIHFSKSLAMKWLHLFPQILGIFKLDFLSSYW